MGNMANTSLTNQRQVFVEEYVRSGNHLEAPKKAGYKDTHTLQYLVCLRNTVTAVQRLKKHYEAQFQSSVDAPFGEN